MCLTVHILTGCVWEPGSRLLCFVEVLGCDGFGIVDYYGAACPFNNNLPGRMCNKLRLLKQNLTGPTLSQLSPVLENKQHIIFLVLHHLLVH